MKNTYFKNLILLLTLVFIGTSINAQNITNYFPSNDPNSINGGGIYAIEQDHNGHMWYGSWTNPEGTPGLSKFDGTNWTRYTTADGLVGDNVRVLFHDSANNLWIGTTEGVTFFDYSSVTNYTTDNGLVDNYVFDIIEDDIGNIWIGTSGGISKFDGTTWTNYTISDNAAIIAIQTIIQDNAGNLWFGSSESGAIKFDGTTWTNYNKDNSGLEADDIWFANYFGPSLTKFNGSTWANFTEADGLPNVKIRALAEDSFGDLWIGSNAGATKFDGYELTTYTTNEGLLNGGVRSFFQDDNDDLWVGTWSSGVSKVEISTISIPDEIFEKSLIQIGIDSDGTINGQVLRTDVFEVTELILTNPLSETNPLFHNELIDLDPLTERISNLTGIEAFVGLTKLGLSYSDLTSVDLSYNKELDDLFLTDAQLTEIDVYNNTKLTRFGVLRNPDIGSLDVSNNLLLEELFVDGTAMTSIDVSSNTSLWKFYGRWGNLTGIDLSKNTNLRDVSVRGSSNLTYLNVKNGNNDKITGFDIRETPNITCVNADSVIALEEGEEEGAEERVSMLMFGYSGGLLSEDCGTVYIPDANFERALIDLGFDGEIGYPTDGLILKSVAASITGLIINDKNITSLVGIEHFVGLQELYCNNNSLTEINLGNNPNIISLHCANNSLTDIDLSSSPNLASLHIYSNKLTLLDVSSNSELLELVCFNNKLTTLDVSNNPLVEFISCSGNELTSLNIANGNNPNFTPPSWTNVSFGADGNPNLECIQVDPGIVHNVPSDWVKDPIVIYSSDCSTKPEHVSIPDANFEQALIDQGIDGNIGDPVNGFILKSEAEAITGQLDVSNENISDLTGIEAFVDLTRLKAWNNQLTGIDVTQNTLLTRLEIVGNQITNIDVTKNTELTILWLESNALSNIDVSKNTKLLNLAVGINPLIAIDVTKNVDLTNLTTEVTQISEIDLSQNVNLQQMWIADNPNLTQIDLSNNPLLFNLGIYNTSITNLDVSNNSLTRLWAYGNPYLSCIQVDADVINSIPADWSKDVSTIYSADGCEGVTTIYVNDTNQTNDVYTTVVGDDTNPGSAALPYATIQHAINRIAIGGTIYVDAGTYTEQVTITKGVTIIGAGQDLTSILEPANTVSPPGTFTEPGVIQTFQDIGDVNIQDLSVIAPFGNVHNILIQSGGSVRNCKVTNGQLGVFFRVESAVKTAIIENNFIQAAGIGINCQGSGLTTNILNNSISNPAGYFSGIFAGLDFGPLPQLTIANNTLSNYFGTGMLVNSYIGNYNNNSIVGNGGLAIQQFSGNIPNATCNWYGLSDPASVAAKISGDINYEPWLADGTDTDPAIIGFQQLPEVCNGTIIPVITLDVRTDIDCFGNNNGLINISVTGGLEPYTFAWTNDGDPGFNSVNKDLSGLTPGSYNLLLTDANGLTASLNNVNIMEPSLLTSSIVNNSTGCSNIALVTAEGGTLDYNYLWSNGATSASIENVPVGTYDVTVTDANGCTTMASIDLTVGEAFNPSASVTDVSCFEADDGVITVINANGDAPFSFSEDGINFEVGEFPFSFNNLEAGTYEIAVRDANGCTGFISKTVSEPDKLLASLVTIESTCSGQSTGSITVEVTGGTGGLSYEWTETESGEYTSSQKSINGLAVGSYLLEVSDNNGCTATLEAVVPTLPEIVVDDIITDVSCRGELNGSIDLTVTGGTGDFAYSWTGNIIATSEDISGLSSGTNYNVTITDLGTGCTVSESYIIEQPDANLSLAASKTNASGCGLGLGTINAIANGGTAPYEYKLDDGSYQKSGDFSMLSGGNYIVWVNDFNGCVLSKEIIITDNGKDQWESNNGKKKAGEISSDGSITNGRIALGTDIADWFKFNTDAEGSNYTVSLTHDSPGFNVALYPDGKNVAALVPISTTATTKETTATTKEYALSGNATYFVEITGGLSYDCYNLSILPEGLASKGSNSKKVNTIVERSVNFWPNPSNAYFNIKVISSNSLERVDIQVFDVNSRLVHKGEFDPNEDYQFGQNLEGGIYIVNLKQASKLDVVRLVKY